MIPKYLLGADLGTGSVKLTLLSTKGRVAATARTEYPTFYPQVAWAEQDPEDWYQAFRETFATLIAKTGIDPCDIAALAADGATHTAVLMDEDFRPLRKAILWTDQRSREQAEYLRREYERKIFDITYHYPDTLWTLPQNLWVRENEPEVWRKTKRMLFAKDYLRYRLTGEYVTDWIEALGSMFFDAGKRHWSPELCGIMGFPTEDLPRVVAPTDLAGRVTARAARETGLAEGTVVVAGAPDTSMEVLAAGAIGLGQSTVKLATAGRICVVTDRACPHRFLLNYYHVIPGKWYPGTGTRSCASSYRWYRDTFGDYEKLEAGKIGKNAYALLDKAAAAIPAGAEGLFFHPYLLGELAPYADPCLRASFIGLSMKHTKAHCARAVLEGVAFSLRDCLPVLHESNVELKEVRLIGGGAQSPLWRQIVADVLGLEARKAANDDSSFGAAMLAGVGTGVFSCFEAAVKRCVGTGETIRPDWDNHEKYTRLFSIYKEIQANLSPVYHRLAQIVMEL